MDLKKLESEIASKKKERVTKDTKLGKQLPTSNIRPKSGYETLAAISQAANMGRMNETTITMKAISNKAEGKSIDDIDLIEVEKKPMPSKNPKPAAPKLDYTSTNIGEDREEQMYKKFQSMGKNSTQTLYEAASNFQSTPQITPQQAEAYKQYYGKYPDGYNPNQMSENVNTQQSMGSNISPMLVEQRLNEIVNEKFAVLAENVISKAIMNVFAKDIIEETMDDLLKRPEVTKYIQETVINTIRDIQQRQKKKQ